VNKNSPGFLLAAKNCQTEPMTSHTFAQLEPFDHLIVLGG
jgi:hypothetical protein